MLSSKYSLSSFGDRLCKSITHDYYTLNNFSVNRIRGFFVADEASLPALPADPGECYLIVKSAVFPLRIIAIYRKMQYNYRVTAQSVRALLYPGSERKIIMIKRLAGCIKEYRTPTILTLVFTILLKNCQMLRPINTKTVK